MILYNISRHSKTDKEDKRKLSKDKKRWLSNNPKNCFCVMNEIEADEFIKLHDTNDRYYFHKTVKTK